jgi:hypothetical protein
MSAGAQVAPLFRAANAAVFNRGNRFWVFDLVIERTHASLVDALAFLVTHPASLPGSVDLRIEKGATVTLAEGAVLTGLKSDTRGLSTAFLYQFTASDYVLAPDPEP